MKVVKTVRWSLELMGYSANEKAFSRIQLRHGLEDLLIISTNCVYLFHVAETTQEYINSTFMTSVGICVFISYVSTVSKTETIFVMIEKVEEICNESM